MLTYGVFLYLSHAKTPNHRYSLAKDNTFIETFSNLHLIQLCERDGHKSYSGLALSPLMHDSWSRSAFLDPFTQLCYEGLFMIQVALDSPGLVYKKSQSRFDEYVRINVLTMASPAQKPIHVQ